MIARIFNFFAVISRFMGRMWLTVLYFTLVLPFGLIARVRAAARPRTAVTCAVTWKPREERADDLGEARKQF